MTGFKVGDKVRAPTLEAGEGVVELHRDHIILPFRVRFPNGRSWFFTVDGKFDVKAEQPALILVERAEAKRKVKVERWISIFRGGDNGGFRTFLYDSESIAKDRSINNYFIKTVKFETEVEIEE